MSQTDDTHESDLLRIEELAFRRERLAYQRTQLESRMRRNDGARRLLTHWAESPTRVTLLVAVLGLIVTVIGGLWQTRTNSRLEKDRFKAELISKALDVPDSIQKANNLRFLIRAGLIADENGSLMQLASRPSSLPQFSSEIAARSPSTPAFNIWPLTFVSSPFHDLAMIDGYVTSANGRDGRFASTQQEHDRGVLADSGDKVVVSVYFHNGANAHQGRENYGTAKRVFISVVLPQEKEEIHNVFAAISCDACATTRSDRGYGGNLPIRSPRPVSLRFVSHTARLCSTLHPDPGTASPDRMKMAVDCGSIEGAAALPLSSEASADGVFNIRLETVPEGYEGLIVFELLVE